MGIEIRNITKTFGTFKALDDVSLDVPPGQLVALLGPSGSGKTTLLRIIAGLDQCDAGTGGSIRFHGEDVANHSAAQRKVGFVFQHYALFRHMSVFENIAFGLRVRPRAIRPNRQQIRHKVEELLRLIGLENLGGRYPAQLSGGQRQRVALARALAVEPKVLLLDEPFGALDAKVRLELRRWLRRLHDELHITSLFVTHDQEEALEVADRVVIMNAGRIEQVGTADEVFHQPASAFVMDFLGHVNLFHGRVEDGKAQFGAWELPHDAADGTARLFVRPYDLEIQTQPNGAAVAATVLRVQSAGPAVKLELRGRDGQTIQAQMPHERFRVSGIGPQSTVYVSLRHARVFVDDYSI